MPINAVLDVFEEDSLYPITEPVTLDEVKLYCKIDFPDEDALLTALMPVARQKLEKYTGLSFVRKQLTVTVSNECGGIEIPYGPILDDIDPAMIVDIDGNAFDQDLIKIIGKQFKYLETPAYPYVQLQYTAGYTKLPEALALAIKAQIFFMYENRGEKLGYGTGVKNYDASYICDAARQLCYAYTRNTELSL